MMDDFSFSQASEEVMELATNFVDKYANYVENLPFDLQRSVTELREIDCNCREILAEIEALYGSFIKEKDMNLKRKATLIKIQRLFGRCQELGDEKISIVQQITEAIENRKKSVEHASHRFKAVYRPEQKNDFNGKRELSKSDVHRPTKRSKRNRHAYSEKTEKEKSSGMDTTPVFSHSQTAGSEGGILHSLNTKQTSNVATENNKSDVPTKIKEEYSSTKKNEKTEKKESSPTNTSTSSSATAATSTTMSTSLPKTSASLKLVSTKTSLSSNKASAASTASNGSTKNSSKGKKKKKKLKHHMERSARSPSPQIDIPIDPDEPTYCVCDQVSFGQMIGCDNKKCPLEWFHFSCVGLTHKPKGKWYCPDCSRDMKDKRKESKKDHR